MALADLASTENGRVHRPRQVSATERRGKRAGAAAPRRGRKLGATELHIFVFCKSGRVPALDLSTGAMVKSRVERFFDASKSWFPREALESTGSDVIGCDWAFASIKLETALL